MVEFILAYYKRIKEFREDNGLTQNQVAEYLNMKQPQCSRCEKGYRGIPSEIFIALADYYDTSVDYILGRKNDR